MKKSRQGTFLSGWQDSNRQAFLLRPSATNVDNEINFLHKKKPPNLLMTFFVGVGRFEPAGVPVVAFCYQCV
jgi:hypothetical protein